MTCKARVYREWVGGRHCSRKAVRDGYCKQHHPDEVTARRKAREERWRRKAESSRRKWKLEEFRRLAFNRLIEMRETGDEQLDKLIKAAEELL